MRKEQKSCVAGFRRCQSPGGHALRGAQCSFILFHVVEGISCALRRLTSN